MRIVTFNIQYGKGRDGRVDLARVAQAVAPADVIALQEVERHWKRTGQADQPLALASLLPGFRWVYGANLDVETELTRADGRRAPARRQFGNMVLARWPILSARNFLLPKAGDLRELSMQRGVLEAVVAAPGRALRVYSTHLCQISAATRRPQVRHIRELLAALPGQGAALTGAHSDPAWLEAPPPPFPAAAIVLGDFNFAPDSEEHALMTRELPALGPGLADAWAAAGEDPTAGVSFVPMEGGPGRRLDHGFATPDVAAAIRGARIDGGCEASDHYPVWFELEW